MYLIVKNVYYHFIGKDKLPKQKLHLDESYNFIVDGFLFKIIYYYKIL
jgi:hypothetical protein